MDRVKTLTVHLGDGMRTDEVEPLVHAIKLMSPVSLVEVNRKDDLADTWAKEQARREILGQIGKILWPK